MLGRELHEDKQRSPSSEKLAHDRHWVSAGPQQPAFEHSREQTSFSRAGPHTDTGHGTDHTISPNVYFNIYNPLFEINFSVHFITRHIDLQHIHSHHATFLHSLSSAVNLTLPQTVYTIDYWYTTLCFFIYTHAHFDSHMTVRLPIVDSPCFRVTSLLLQASTYFTEIWWFVCS